MSRDTRPLESRQPTIEAALRYLGTRDHGVLVELLEIAINRPNGDPGKALAALTMPTATLEGWTPAERAGALWCLINEGIHDPDISPTAQSRRLHALLAAFRLPDDLIKKPWSTSLTERFKQLQSLSVVFGKPTSTQPMETAWKRGVGALAEYLEARFGQLRSADDWAKYRSSIRSDPQSRPQAEPDASVPPCRYREPSPGAQPLFVDLFTTTVFMRNRAVYRRITERLITARADDVEYYTARGFAGKHPRLKYVPVQALWGCRAEFIEPTKAGRPAVTRLRFPSPLSEGEQAYFASEIIDENITEERHWIDVDVDHYGIAPGRVIFGDRLPVSGLTIRVEFDDGHLPEAVWWYAELNESERYDRPPSGDPHLLPLVGNSIQYTFVGLGCQPRESYGLAFSWSSC